MVSKVLLINPSYSASYGGSKTSPATYQIVRKTKNKLKSVQELGI